MRIPLGTVVRDKVTGLVGVAENRATFLYGCDRYYIQPRMKDDGTIPDGKMVDEPQLEIVNEARVMKPVGEPKQLVKLGQVVLDPVLGIKGTVTGRAVYLNGCARVFIEPKRKSQDDLESWWVDEQQVEIQKTFTGKDKVTHEPTTATTTTTGGPARSSSKY